MSQQKDKSKPPKKHNFCNNKQNNKDPKPSQSAISLKCDKRSKQKGKKTERHCNFCGKDNHDEYKCFKKYGNLGSSNEEAPHQHRFVFKI